MENNTNETKLNLWAMLASFLLGGIIGFLVSPVKKGVVIGSYNRVPDNERENGDFCDYDDDFYDDFFDIEEDEENEDNGHKWEDETDSYSF